MVKSPPTSKNWSGYVARKGKFTTVTGTWTLPPAPPAASPSDVVVWVGIGGSTTSDLIQAGTEEKRDPNGALKVDAWIELLPQLMVPVPLVVHPGDSLSVTIANTQPFQWTVSFVNGTTGERFQQGETYASTYSSAEWVVERPSYSGSLQNLAPFGQVTISAATTVLNAQSVTAAAAGAAPLAMVDSSGNLLDRVSVFSADGATFTVMRA
jgi:hypothetical protein